MRKYKRLPASDLTHQPYVQRAKFPQRGRMPLRITSASRETAEVRYRPVEDVAHRCHVAGHKPLVSSRQRLSGSFPSAIGMRSANAGGDEIANGLLPLRELQGREDMIPCPKKALCCRA